MAKNKIEHKEAQSALKLLDRQEAGDKRILLTLPPLIGADEKDVHTTHPPGPRPGEEGASGNGCKDLVYWLKR